MAKLVFRYGAMNAGKTTLLLQVAYNYEERGKKVLLLKSKTDTKANDFVLSRIGLKRKVDIYIGPKESFFEEKYFSKIQKVDAIVVDEAHFLTPVQIEELWKISKQEDIPVVCYGLRSDFTTHLFEGSQRLFELADELTELITICSCGKKARFNARMVDHKYTTEGDTVVIDGSNKEVTYDSLCGSCYIEKVLKENSPS
ncbi:MAG: thymidine kinase [Bacilli bacterium]|nr:thymidine kinase [Bacilli bacterium]